MTLFPFYYTSNNAREKKEKKKNTIHIYPDSGQLLMQTSVPDLNALKLQRSSRDQRIAAQHISF